MTKALGRTAVCGYVALENSRVSGRGPLAAAPSAALGILSDRGVRSGGAPQPQPQNGGLPHCRRQLLEEHETRE